MYVGGKAIRLGGSRRWSRQGGAYKQKGVMDNRVGWQHEQVEKQEGR